MLGFLILGVTGIALATWLALQARQHGVTPGQVSVACPTCRVPMVPLTSGPSTDPRHVRSYDVLACPSCTNAVTLVHGTRSRWAYCPECQQRTLETPCIRLTGPAAPAHEGAQVEVREHCHLCSYEASVIVSGEPSSAIRPVGSARGQVIRFPRGRTRERP